MRFRISNRTLGIGLCVVVAGMIGASFAAVPLYRLFCAATGYAGTPQIGPEAAPGAVTRMITVRFNANTNPGLPWNFAPDKHKVTLPLGEEQLAFFSAQNRSDTPITGVALYNVTPAKVGRYFHKTACFCFDSQTLQPDQKMEFPVSFWVDPQLAKDPNTAEVHTITLSYTFFRSMKDAEKSGALAKAGEHVGAISAANLSRLEKDGTERPN